MRCYDRLFAVPRPGGGVDGDAWLHDLNPESVQVAAAQLEPALALAAPGTVFQFERLGYFVADQAGHGAGGCTFNRVVTLRDSWAKLEVPAG